MRRRSAEPNESRMGGASQVERSLDSSYRASPRLQEQVEMLDNVKCQVQMVLGGQKSCSRRRKRQAGGESDGQVRNEWARNPRNPRQGTETYCIATHLLTHSNYSARNPRNPRQGTETVAPARPSADQVRNRLEIHGILVRGLKPRCPADVAGLHDAVARNPRNPRQGTETIAVIARQITAMTAYVPRNPRNPRQGTETRRH